jgi:hypothetical protein
MGAFGSIGIGNTRVTQGFVNSLQWRYNMNRTAGKPVRIDSFFPSIRMSRGLLFGVIIIGALLAFEFFNYSTTEFALHDLLGELEFFGIAWATILAIAFCGIDFAGIARLFTPEAGTDEPSEVWYLFAAWLLAATMNAMLTWWGVSIALLNHASLGNAVVSQELLLKVVPVFVALMVWLIRVLIIGTFSAAGPRLFSQAERGEYVARSTALPARMLGKSSAGAPAQASFSQGQTFRPAPKASSMPENTYTRPEPTYHPVGMAAKPTSENRSPRS